MAQTLESNLTLAGSFTTSAPPPLLFPAVMIVESVRVTLHADGSYEGDGAAFIEAVKNAHNNYADPYLRVVLWLLCNVIRSQPAKTA